MDLLTVLRERIDGDVSTDREAREECSRDASVFCVYPELVVYPRHARDVQTIVRTAQEARSEGHDVTLTARSAGTCMTGGPLSESIVVEMTRYMNELVAVKPDVPEATAQPGLFYRDFEAATLEHDLLLPSYPASREICTVGGMLLNNAAGENTLAYGQTVDYVRGVKMVLRDGEECTFGELPLSELEQKKQQDSAEGEIYRQLHDLFEAHYDTIKQAEPQVSKNSSGYLLWRAYDREREVIDLAKLIAGSQGTFGIVTEVTYALIRPKHHRRLLVLFLPDVDELAEVTNTLREYQPESIESYDDQTFSIALRFFPDLVTHMKGNLFRLGIGFLPEFFMAVTGGIPKMVILAEFTADTPEEAVTQAEDAQAALQQYTVQSKIARTERAMRKYWLFRRESFNLLRQHISGKRTAPIIEDVVVRPEDLPTYLPELYEILGDYSDRMVYTVAGHVGNGNFHIIPLMNFQQPNLQATFRDICDRVHELTFSYGGSMSAEHNDGLIRTPYLPQMYGDEVYELFQHTKAIFDPDTLFNPHKKVDCSWNFAMERVDIPADASTADENASQSILDRLSITLSWWQAAIYELALLTLGILIGGYWPSFASYSAPLLWLIFFLASGYILFLWIKQLRQTYTKDR
jgi:FAD/FMN-containing dehydrogenase